MNDKMIYTVYDTRNNSDNFVKDGERRLGISPEKRKTRDFTHVSRERDLRSGTVQSTSELFERYVNIESGRN